MDLLSVEAMDKIQICLELLQKDNYIDKDLSIKDAYEQAIGIYNIERTASDMWRKVWNHEIISLFQMEKASGIQGINLTKPQSVDDLAVLNSAIRLMASDGGESPLEKFARFKINYPAEWYNEMDKYGIDKKHYPMLESILSNSYGLCISQEQFMELVQQPELGGFSLTWSDSLRKSIAKKNPEAYDKLEKEFFEITKEKGCDEKLCWYVWKVLIAMNRGYGFNASHTLAYSLIGLQEMNLAYKYPVIYWNTSNLIVNSGGDSEGGQADYNKIAKALGEVLKAGIKVSPVDINESDYGFKPDVKNNQILYGMKALLKVGDEVIAAIINNRPYDSIKDFYYKVKPNKQAMVSLIKSGAFDNLIDRKLGMGWYLWETCDKKSRITLQNMNSLIKYNLLPELNEAQVKARRVYEFNRYLKAICKIKTDTLYYHLDTRAIDFLAELNYASMIEFDGSIYGLNMKAWDKIYQGYMDVFRTWISENKEEILNSLNAAIFKEDWDKYALGSYSYWEMESCAIYFHPHELINVNNSKYGFVNFNSLPEDPIVEKSFYRGGKEVRMFKLQKIAGTCIAKDKAKATVSVLTTDGVVNVKFRKEYFALFDRIISQVQPDGKKKQIEKSWFSKGSKIIVQGVRQGDTFVAKKYASQGDNVHQLYRITEIRDNGDLRITSERASGLEEEDND